MKFRHAALEFDKSFQRINERSGFGRCDGVCFFAGFKFGVGCPNDPCFSADGKFDFFVDRGGVRCRQFREHQIPRQQRMTRFGVRSGVRYEIPRFEQFFDFPNVPDFRRNWIFQTENVRTFHPFSGEHVTFRVRRFRFPATIQINGFCSC